MNELLYKKYLKKDDLYLHADIHGAGSTVIKNPLKGKRVPDQTINEAAVYAMSRSKAWDNKQVGNAWWVYSWQVSKSAKSGEYLPTGSFMIRGRKNYVPVYRVDMGVAILFRLDQSSVSNHLNERKSKQQDDDDEQQQDE